MTNGFTEKDGRTTDSFTVADCRQTDPLAFDRGCEKVVLPLPPGLEGDTRFEMEVYAKFMGHLRKVPNSRFEIKVLSAISFTADIMQAGEALVAKTLVDLGLRAPRKAFPASFLNFADRSLQRQMWDHSGSQTDGLQELRDHWTLIGECRFEPMFAGDVRMSTLGAYDLA